MRTAVAVLICCLLGQYLVFLATPEPGQSSTSRLQGVIIFIGVIITLPMLPFAFVVEQFLPPMPPIAIGVVASLLTAVVFGVIVRWLPRRSRYENV